MFRFTIRDLLWLMVVVGMGIGLWVEWRFNSAEATSRRTEQIVLRWLGKNSYAVMQSGGRHMARPLPPAMDIKLWIAEGKKIPNIEPALRSLLITRDARVELPLVVMGLQYLGNSESVPALIDCFSNPSIHLRMQAAVALGQLGDHRAIEPLGKVVASDTDQNVRANAVLALGFIGGEEGIPYVEAATRDTSAFVAESARDALGYFNNGRY